MVLKLITKELQTKTIVFSWVQMLKGVLKNKKNL